MPINIKPTPKCAIAPPESDLFTLLTVNRYFEVGDDQVNTSQR
jgi:hypothetical protein